MTRIKTTLDFTRVLGYIVQVRFLSPAVLVKVNKYKQMSCFPRKYGIFVCNDISQKCKQMYVLHTDFTTI